MTEFSVAFQTDKPLSSYGRLGRLSESYGFDRVSVYNDLLYQPSWPALFEMARSTTSIILGPAAVNPFTSHPINIAGYAALLDEMSAGRAYLGLARGAWLDFLGIDHPKPLTAMEEAFACIDHLLHQRPDPLAGEFFPLIGGDSLHWSVHRPGIPKLLGSWGLKTLTRCYNYIDEVKLGGSANPDMVSHFIRHRDRICQAVDADHTVGIVMGAVCVVDEDGEQARQLARQEVALYLPVIASLDPTIGLPTTTRETMQQAAAEFDHATIASLVSDDLLEKFAFAGTPEEVATQSQALIDAGCSRIEYGTPHGIRPDLGLELLGRQVLPVLKSYISE